MAKLRSEDIADLSGLIAQLGESIKLAEDLRDVLVKDIKESIGNFKEIKPVDADSLKKFNTATADLKAKTEALNTVNAKRKALQQENFRLEKARITSQAKLIKGTSKVAKETAKINEKRKEQNKLIREQAKRELGLINAYDLEAKKLGQLRRKYKDLAAQNKANTKEGRALLDQISTLDNKLKGIDAKVGQFQRNVGNYGSAWDRVSGSLKRIRGQAVLAVTSLVGLNQAVRGIEESVDAAKEFETSFTNVLTLLDQAEVSQFGTLLEEGSLDIVRQYGFEIQDVNKALFDAISAGIPAGEAINFLNESSKSALAGATDLSTVVDGTTSILNAFRLGAEETAAVQDALFSAQKEGKTTVEELSNSIGQLAPIASSLGISYQEVLAAQAALTKGGISTENATTALKGLFVALEKPSKDAIENIESLNEQLGINIPTSASELKAAGLGQALQDISTAAEFNEDAIANIIPNVRALTAATALQAEGLDEYNNILNTVTEDTGEASSRLQGFQRVQETASQKSKRLSGEIKTLQVEIGKKLIPIINDIKAGVIDFVKFIGKNRTEIARLVTMIGSAVIAYKAFRTIQKFNNNELVKGSRIEKALATSTKLLAAAKALLTGQTKKARAELKALNTTMKVSPVGILISGMALLATSLIDFGGAADDAAAKQERLNRAMERGAENARKFNKEQESNLSDLEKEINQRIELAAREGATEEELAALRKKAIQELQTSTNQAIGSTLKKKEGIDQTVRSLEFFLTQQEKIKAEIDKEPVETSYTKSGRAIITTTARAKELEKTLKTVKGTTEAQLEAIKKQNPELLFAVDSEEVLKQLRSESNNLQEGYNALLQKSVDLTHEEELALADAANAQADISKEQEAAFKRRLKELETLKRRLEDLQAEGIIDDEERELRKVQLRFNREIEAIKGNSEVEKQLRIELAESLATEEEKIRQKFRDERLRGEIEFEMKAVGETLALRKLNNEKFIENDKALKLANLQAEEQALNERLAILREFGEDTTALELELSKKSQQIAAQKLAIQKEIDKNNFDQEMDAITKQQKLRELDIIKSTATEKEKQAQLLQLQIDGLKKEIEALEAFGEDATDKRIELAKLEQKQINDANAEKIAAQKEVFETLNQIADEFAEMQRRRDQEALSRLDEQIAAVKKRQDTFRALAESGDLDAEKSIAAEIKREEKLEKEKERIQRKAARRELFISAFKTYTAKIEADDPTPLRSTLRDLALLSAAISGLQTFYDGTGGKTLGEVMGAPQLNTARDQYVIRADKDEIILNPNESRKYQAMGGLDGMKSIQDQYASSGSATLFDHLNAEPMYRYVPAESNVANEIRQVSYQLHKQGKTLDVIADKPVYMGLDIDDQNDLWIKVFKHRDRIEKQVGRISDIGY